MTSYTVNPDDVSTDEESPVLPMHTVNKSVQIDERDLEAVVQAEASEPESLEDQDETPEPEATPSKKPRVSSPVPPVSEPVQEEAPKPSYYAGFFPKRIYDMVARSPFLMTLPCFPSASALPTPGQVYPLALGKYYHCTYSKQEEVPRWMLQLDENDQTPKELVDIAYSHTHEVLRDVDLRLKSYMQLKLYPKYSLAAQEDDFARDEEEDGTLLLPYVLDWCQQDHRDRAIDAEASV